MHNSPRLSLSHPHSLRHRVPHARRSRLLGGRLSALLVIVGLAVALSACSSSGSKGGSGDTKAGSSDAGITIKNFAFTASPVKSGSTVTVTNNDTATHTVTSDDGSSFNLTVAAGKSATFTAPAAGTYAFHCNIHNTMKSTLTVT